MPTVGSTASYQIPNPEPADPVRDGAANMRAIAERVAVLLQAAMPNGLGVRGGSAVVARGQNGEAIIPISPAFVRDFAPNIGSITVGIEASGSIPIFITSYQPQQWSWQWTLIVKT